MADDKPGDGFFGWLGRQIGHVRKAVKTDVAPPPPAPAQPEASPPPQTPGVLYRDARTEEVEMPDQPGVILRRTTIDEVIVDNKQGESGRQP